MRLIRIHRISRGVTVLYRTVKDFLTDWTDSQAGTLQVLEAVTDEKLNQAITPGHNTLGWLGWHLANSITFFASLVGLNVQPPGNRDVVPETASEIVDGYRKVSELFNKAVEQNFSDEKMIENIDLFGNPTPRGAVLRRMIDHQTHHRGQMTVLLRQAGLPVPGVMGPTKEQQ